MSISLTGIILVQLYWINTSLKKSEEEFKLHIQQVLGNVAQVVDNKELISFYKQYQKIKDSIGKDPETSTLKEFYFLERDRKTNETILYTNSIVAENYGISGSFFDKSAKSLSLDNIIANRKTEIFDGSTVDNSKIKLNNSPNLTIEKKGNLSILDKANFQVYFKDIVTQRPIQDRIKFNDLEKDIKNELDKYEIKTPFEFAVYSNGLATKIRSNNFNYDKEKTFSIPILLDNEKTSDYRLLISFPQKSKFLFSSLLGLSFLSLLFTLVIILTYSSALRLLMNQKQISEIKTDFINNMTHEFKTPIATISLALDAIRNPKIIDDKEKVQRYLQMIKDENKRMHAQVENVLRISKLEKNELDISKVTHDVHEILDHAVEHISLIVEDRNGFIKKQFNATRTTILLNEMHFTNVIVNILDNAVKYSTQEPKITVTTENSKDFIIIKIKDEGDGISKTALKKVFDKFYREHTGDIHNVKGHGLGLAYVKQIVEDHNGQIYVESDKGKGSTFFLKMPLIN